MDIDEQTVVEIAQKAGDIIMDVYQGDDFNVQTKHDDGFDSPLTKADTQANDYIVKQLADVSELPIVSEENELSHTIMANTFWLIDPLDGTKEFIKKNDEFTVNIALVKDGRAIFGVVHAPALGATYWNEDNKAYKLAGDTTSQIKADSDPDTLVAVASRSHLNDETQEFLDEHDITETISAGSSLKFCLVAEGKAHAYPRFAPTMLWDTAAAHAVAKAAGATVTNAETGDELRYNLGELKNPFFICASVDLPAKESAS